jgi:transposase
MLIIDNASFYRIARVEQLCYKAGVKLVYLLLYLLDLNPIKEFFAKLKRFIKKH